MFFWLFSLLYAAALLGLLVVARYAPNWYTVAKGSCSALFVLGGVLAYWQGQRQAPGNFWLLLAALVLCMAGDILLGLANKRTPFAAKPFLAGAGSFAAAHILFCILYCRFAPLAWYDFVLPVLLLLLVFVLEKTGRVHLGKMRAPGYFYTFFVGFMASKSLELGIFVWQISARGLVTALGGLLFLISDVILLFLYFGKTPAKWRRYANLSTYYGGIYLVALAAYWL